jgi:hypothetical protein
MRRILVATALLASFATTASFASTAATDANTQVTRISTGVTAPQLLTSAAVQIPADSFDTILPKQVEVGISLNVDQKGNAQDVKVFKSVNPAIDARVIAAVQQFHFRPASLDNQVIPVNLNLTVVVQR